MSSSWPAVSALVDKVRRALYDYVRRQDHPVTREEAAEAHDISRSLAAFHLDKLVEVGLLDASAQAPPPLPRGRGRTPKVYEVSDAPITLSIPERRYELAAQILAEAIAQSPVDVRAAVLRSARRHGRQAAAGLLGAGGERAGAGGERPVGERAGAVGERAAASGLARACQVLARLGFEPGRLADGRVRLHNCPFHALAMRQPELICRLNRAFVQGVLSEVDASGVTARLAPQQDACCVELH